MIIIKNSLLLVMWTLISVLVGIGFMVVSNDTKQFLRLRQNVGYDSDMTIYTYKDKES
jgi:hypothetical protein